MLAKILKLFGADANATERRQQILDAEEYLRSVVDFVPDGIVAIDSSGRIQTFNPAAKRIFGYERSDIVGQDMRVLLAEPYRSMPNRYISCEGAGIDAESVGSAREVLGQHKDGAVFPMELAVNAFHVGPRLFFTGIVRDITHRKSLEREVHDRLKQLAEEDQKKDQFISVLGHELRNPLGPMSNGLQILRRSQTLADRRTEATLGLMERQLARMVRLIDDLLDVSRIKIGKVELRHDRVDLVSLVQHAIDAMRSEFQAKAQRVVTSYAEEHVYLDADATRIEQVVTNLLTNASKYSDPGTQVDVSLSLSGPMARVSVRDQGIGIPRDQIATVFEIFTQLESAADRRQGGLGLGLALVKRLTELHGGKVQVHSDGPGQGSEFIVELPVLGERRGTERNTERAAIAPGNHRVLVIDDNKDSADTLSALLADQGHSVTTLYGGEGAVEEVVRQSPDVVICDIGMPGISGLDVARQLRLVFSDRPLTLIAATGYGRTEDVASAKAAGFDEHLIKPLDFDKLQAAMNRKAA